jgi:hypothetical protein
MSEEYYETAILTENLNGDPVIRTAYMTEKQRDNYCNNLINNLPHKDKLITTIKEDPKLM